jgi:hypothetical protein
VSKNKQDGIDDSSLWHKTTQVLLPSLTILGFLLTSLKKPQYGLIFNLLSQIFWLYASWQAWKKANQIGILVTTLFILVVVLFGVINYWLIGN